MTDDKLLGDRQLARRPLTASKADQKLFVERAELGAIRSAVDLGVNVFLTGAPGSGKTTLLRRIQHELTDRCIFVQAESNPTANGLLRAMARELTIGSGVDTYWREFAFTDTEADVSVVAQALQTRLPLPDDGLVVLVDGASAEHLTVIFGRYRDQLWESRLNWVVSSRIGALEPPADSFFDRIITLSPLSETQLGELVHRRTAHLADKEIDALLELIAPAHPLEAILALQAVLLSSDPKDVLEAIALERDRVHGLPDRLRLLYQALSAVGPTHAGDARLLERTGTSRTRATHGLKELETLALVIAERDGRKVLYRTLRHALVHASDPVSTRLLVEVLRQSAES